MKRRWLCIVVAVLGSLLTFATSAHAECAWVLWFKVETTNYISQSASYYGQWNFIEVTRNLENCERNLTERIKEEVQAILTTANEKTLPGGLPGPKSLAWKIHERTVTTARSAPKGP